MTSDERLALLIGGLMAVLALFVFWLVPRGESGYLIAPGAILAAIVLGALHGSPHGNGSALAIAMLGTAINFVLYWWLGRVAIKVCRAVKKSPGAP